MHAAITGDEGPALTSAGACTLHYLGAGLFDNIVDGELSPAWEGREAGEASLAAATLLASLPQRSIARLRERATPVVRLWALAHLFAETLLAMSAGEHEDVIFRLLERRPGRGRQRDDATHPRLAVGAARGSNPQRALGQKTLAPPARLFRPGRPTPALIKMVGC